MSDDPGLMSSDSGNDQCSTNNLFLLSNDDHRGSGDTGDVKCTEDKTNNQLMHNENNTNDNTNEVNFDIQTNNRTNETGNILLTNEIDSDHNNKHKQYFYRKQSDKLAENLGSNQLNFEPDLNSNKLINLNSVLLSTNHTNQIESNKRPLKYHETKKSTDKVKVYMNHLYETDADVRVNENNEESGDNNDKNYNNNNNNDIAVNDENAIIMEDDMDEDEEELGTGTYDRNSHFDDINNNDDNKKKNSTNCGSFKFNTDKFKYSNIKTKHSENSNNNYTSYLLSDHENSLMNQEWNKNASHYDTSETESHEHCTNRTNLIVNYLPPFMNQEEVKSLFTSIGHVESCKLVKDKMTGESLGYAFVNFSEATDAEKAIKMLNGMRIQNKTIKVTLARPSSESIKGANLYICGLPKDMDQSDLIKLFGKCGQIITARILYDYKTGQSRGVAFIRFDQRYEAELAIEHLNGFRIPGKHSGETQNEPLIVKFANSPTLMKNDNLSMALMKQAAQLQSVAAAVCTPACRSAASAVAAAGLLNPFQQLASLSSRLKYSGSITSSPSSPVANTSELLPAMATAAAVVNPFLAPAVAASTGALTTQGWCIFVYNLAPETDECNLWQLFGPFGAVQTVKVVRESNSNNNSNSSNLSNSKCKGFGFVTMSNYEEAIMAIHSLNGFLLGDRILQVSFKSTPLSNKIRLAYASPNDNTFQLPTELANDRELENSPIEQMKQNKKFSTNLTTSNTTASSNTTSSNNNQWTKISKLDGINNNNNNNNDNILDSNKVKHSHGSNNYAAMNSTTNKMSSSNTTMQKLFSNDCSNKGTPMQLAKCFKHTETNSSNSNNNSNSLFKKDYRTDLAESFSAALSIQAVEKITSQQNNNNIKNSKYQCYQPSSCFHPHHQKYMRKY